MVTVVSDWMGSIVEIVSMMRNEFVIFAIAVTVHGLLFSSHRISGTKTSAGQKLGHARKIFEDPVTGPKLADPMGCARHSHAKSEAERNASLRQQERELHSVAFEALRGLRKGQRADEVSRVMGEVMVLTAGKEMVEESLMSVYVDTCFRIGRMDILRQWVRQHEAIFPKLKKEHTLSTIIRAYGAVGDAAGAWSVWRQLRTSHITLGCVTVGCMVGALVANGDPEAAYELIQELAANESTKSSVNAVVFGTVIKGFAHQKKFCRAWLVYEELKQAGVQRTSATFNTLIDACARCEQAYRIPGLLNDMVEQGIQPDLITYGAALKGYCQEGDVDKAIDLLQGMREKTDYKLDEMMYNSLLDGCARTGLWSRALAVIDEMVGAGVPPSTYTLSVLVKVGRRSSTSLDKIFEVVENLIHMHKVSLNVYVCNNMIHLCSDRKNWDKAMHVFQSLLMTGAHPDARTYTVLLKGLMSNGQYDSADGIVRAALSMTGAHASLCKGVCGDLNRLRPVSSLPKQVLLEVVDGMIAGGDLGRQLAHRLFQDMKHQSVMIDPSLKLRFATHFAKRNW